MEYKKRPPIRVAFLFILVSGTKIYQIDAGSGAYADQN